jgi:A/G-specific adenine glycosylase
MVISFIKDEAEFILMRKRTGNDIWKNMYDFPCIETENASDTKEVLDKCVKSELFGGFPIVVNHVSDEYIHQLSHRRLLARFIRIELKGEPELPVNITSVRKDLIAELPLPRLIDRYIANSLY